MKFIDAHHHLWNPISSDPYIDYQWLRKIGQMKPFGDPTSIQRDYLIDEFAKESDQHEIVGSVHVQADGALSDPIKETAWIDSIAKNNAFPIAIVAFANLAQKNVDQVLEAHKQYQSIRGIRQIIGHLPKRNELSFAQEDLLENKLWREQFSLLKEFDLSFDLQLYPEQLIKAADVLHKESQIPIVIDHAASPYDLTLKGFHLWQKNLEYIAQLSNVSIKLSGFGMYNTHWDAATIQDHFQTILELFQPERIMFGSNFPVDKLMRKYDFILEQLVLLTKDLTADQQRAIFFDTARTVYRFDL